MYCPVYRNFAKKSTFCWQPTAQSIIEHSNIHSTWFDIKNLVLELPRRETKKSLGLLIKSGVQKI